jgi:hypothetical protein
MKRRNARQDHWADLEISAMQSNPIYTGIVVDATITHFGRPHNRDKFLGIALEIASAHGLDFLMRKFMLELKSHTAWTLLIPVHESYAEPRKAIITEEQFIQAGVALMRKTSIGAYLTTVLDNLQQGALFLK